MITRDLTTTSEIAASTIARNVTSLIPISEGAIRPALNMQNYGSIIANILEAELIPLRIKPNTRKPFAGEAFSEMDCKTAEGKDPNYWDGSNLAIRTGTRLSDGSYLVVLDFDTSKGLDAGGYLEYLKEKFPAETSGYEVITPSGGRHLYFKSQVALPNSQGKLCKNVDVRGINGYVLVPPSIIDGKQYFSLDTLTAREIEKLPFLPQSLVDELTSNKPKDELEPKLNQAQREISQANRDEIFPFLLKATSSGAFDSHEDWIRLGFGLYNSGFTKKQWEELSWNDPRTKKIIDSNWTSNFSDQKEGNQVGFGTLVDWAKKEGYVRNQNWEDLISFSQTFIPYRGRKYWGKVTAGEEHLKRLHDTIHKAQEGENTFFFEGGEFADSYLSEKSLKLAYSDQQCFGEIEVDGKHVPVPFTPADWLIKNCPLAKVKPAKDKPRLYRENGELFLNPFQGFPFYSETVNATQEIHGKIILEWINRIICSGRADVENFVLDLMAAKRQNPFHKIGKTIALNGEFGTGKNTFFQKIFGALFPKKNFVYINKTEQISGQFNGELENALLVFLDEACWGGNKNEADILKGYSNETISIHRKGKTPYIAPNQFEVLIASNKAWVAPVEAGGDRRYLVLTTSNEDKNNPDAIARLHDAIANGGLYYLDKFLRERNITTDFYSNNCIPHTHEKYENILMGLPRWAKFFLDAYQNDELQSSQSRSNVQGKFSGRYKASELFDCFAYSQNGRGSISNKDFGSNLTNHFPKTFMKSRGSDGNWYQIESQYFLSELATFTGIPHEALQKIVE